MDASANKSGERGGVDTRSRYEDLAKPGKPNEDADEKKEKAKKEEESRLAKEKAAEKAKVMAASSSERADMAAGNPLSPEASTASIEATPTTTPDAAPTTAPTTTPTTTPPGDSSDTGKNDWGDKIKTFFTDFWGKVKGFFESVSGWFGGKKDAEKVTPPATPPTAPSGAARSATASAPTTPSAEKQAFNPADTNPEANKVSNEIPTELNDELKKIAASNGATLSIAPKMVYAGNPKFNYAEVMKEQKMGCLQRTQEFAPSFNSRLPKKTVQIATKMAHVILRFLRAGKIPFLYAVQVNIDGANIRLPCTWHQHPNTAEHRAQLARSGFKPHQIEGLIKKHPGVEVWAQSGNVAPPETKSTPQDIA